MKSGFVSIVGRPNVGKSSLLNSILERKIAITSNVSGTTRNIIQGIYNDDDCQIIFIDTPGIHKPVNKLGTMMNKKAYTMIDDVDIVLFLIDVTKDFGKGDNFILEKLKLLNKPVLLVLNKVDLIDKRKILELINRYKDLYDFKEIIPISATKYDNIDDLIKTIKKYLPHNEKYYNDDEIVVIASERPVIQTVMNVDASDVKELTPGSAIIVGKNGNLHIDDILGEGKNQRCSFERIYFSRGSDKDIYFERKALGHYVAHDVMDAIGHDLDNTVLSFIPNTAEVAFYGMLEGLGEYLVAEKAEKIKALNVNDKEYANKLNRIVSRHLRCEKIAIKDIKLRTFIAEGAARNDLAAHVYDVTYGVVKPTDNLVVIDDSIVRGTTLKQSILSMLGRLNPKKIVVVSSSPQVRYPDCYGIDMSRMSEFIAFRAAIALLKERGMQNRIDEVYRDCLHQLELPIGEMHNAVKGIYAPFTDKEISAKMADMLKPENLTAEVEIIYQTLEGLHKAIPACPGDWYFSGDYPTPGGNRVVNRAFVNYYEGNPDLR